MTSRSILRGIAFTGLSLSCVWCSSSDNGTSGNGDDGGVASDGGVVVLPDGAVVPVKNDSGASDSGPSGGDDGSTPPPYDAGPSTTGAQSVLQRGNDIHRSATYTAPALTAAAAKTIAATTTFNTNAVWPQQGKTENQGTASVLYVEQGPAQAGCPAGATGCTATARTANAGMFFAFPAVGSNPNIIAFDETSGLPVWTAHVTSGGDGIRGTPVIDPVSRRLFAISGNNPHLVHAIAIDTGVEVTTGGWPVTLSNTTLKYNASTFNSGAQNQHGASLLFNGILYIPFGGQYGDGGNYLGWIVAIDISNPTRLAGWATQSARSGIWGSGGLASDGTYVYGVTGDTSGLARDVSDSQEVVRVKGLAEFTRDSASIFVPNEWQGWDRPAGDLDFGASTPAYVPLPAGSTPSSLLIAPAKGGRLYVLNGSDLSGGTYPKTGGELANLVVASLTAESVYTAPTIYTSASGLHATIGVGTGPVCPTGSPTSKAMIMSVLLKPGTAAVATTAWCAAVAGGGHMNYPPISTTSDGVSKDPLVWFVNGTQLTAVDGDTGKVVVTTTGAACDNVPSMSFPIVANNRVVVAGLNHLCSWSLNGK